jgi:peptidoglycan/LPS O-acetylase OafA/YrhL
VVLFYKRIKMRADQQIRTTTSLRGIEALRGVAALGVVAFHAIVMSGVTLDRTQTALLRNGAAGVDIFFVISGFVMVISARRLQGQAGAAWRFAWARLRRIVPLYWLCSAAKIAMILAAPGIGKATLSAGFILASLLFLPAHDAQGRFAPVLPVAWTLSFEMLFYALFALALALRRSPALWVPPVLAAIVALRLSGLGAHDIGNPIILEFGLGTTLATLWLRGWKLPGRLAWPVMGTALVLLAFVPGHALGTRVLSWGLPACALVAATVSLESVLAPRMPKIVLGLGAASYAIYLTHGFTRNALAAMLSAMPHAMRGAGIVVPTLILASAAFGWFVHVAIEKPLLFRRKSVPLPVRAPCVLVLAGGGVSPLSGGVGTLLQNLLEVWAKQGAAPRIRIADTRGTGGAMQAILCFTGSLCVLVWLCATRRVDLVHAHMTTRGSAARKVFLCGLAMALGVKFILHMHGADFIPFHRRLPAVLRWPLDAMLRRASHVVVLGENWRGFLVREAGVPAGRISVIPNGVPRPEACAKQAGATPKLLFLGRLCTRKGVPDLIAALAMPSLRDKAWHATIAGDGNAAPYRAMLNWHCLHARVTMPGWTGRRETASLLAQSDILVLPSYHEALPLAVVEALAAGVAVITTPVGAVPEFLQDGVSALLVRPGAPAELAGAILRLLDDAGLRAEIARAGQAVFCERLDIAGIAGRIAALYREVATPPDPGVGLTKAPARTRSAGPTLLGSPAPPA